MRLLIVVLKEVSISDHRNVVAAYLIILANFSKINKLINEIKKNIYLSFLGSFIHIWKVVRASLRHWG